ncbi:MupA/Atu3671 family FMN-dependent luciferase-like monooxygenase [Streptomyces sp. NPDC005799]|uniref:type I polyketide synthase n=1 Tax=Streptomyces sp. NPDC005799 TaxID=3154678 RepID=UPI00340A361A
MITDNHRPADIAIIGMSCRFPGAQDPKSLWENLCAGRESISQFTEAELLRSGVGLDLVGHPGYVRAAGVISDAEMFDAELFRFTDREARLLDPQHRVFLECAWSALEDSAHNPATFDGPIGVYCGSSENAYYLTNLLPDQSFVDSVDPYILRLASGKDYLATRTSYKLGLTGPSVTVQTACSTSLVALHIARQALLARDCEIAIVGASSLRVPQHKGYIYQDGGINSPDGHCRPFDAQARGTVPSSGTGVVILRRLEDAIEDHDHIYAVLKGTAVNNDGAFKAGFTAPSIQGQAAVIAAALATSGVDPGSISFIEAHGTGTLVGDPIEVEALMQVFGAAKPEPRTCRIGSIKANIGHLDVASGMAGLIKVALSLQHRTLPPAINFEHENPLLGLAAGPFFVDSSVARFEASDAPVTAGLSSFGIGGTNVHAVLQEYRAASAREDGSDPNARAICISARTAESLRYLALDLANYIDESGAVPSLSDFAFSLHEGRRELDYRYAFIAPTIDAAALALSQIDSASIVHARRDPRVLFAFDDESVNIEMIKDAYDSSATFRGYFDECANTFQVMDGVDLRRNLIFADRSESTRPPLPLIFAYEYSVALMYIDVGIAPVALVGGGVGECVAACVAGVMSPRDALRLVAAYEQFDREASAVQRNLIMEGFGEFLLGEPTLPFVSTITGRWVSRQDAQSPTYWSMRWNEALQLDTALVTALEVGAEAVVVVGGVDDTLITSLDPMLRSRGATLHSWHVMDASQGSAYREFLRVVTSMWTAGWRVRWDALDSDESARRVSLPTYRFERKRHWRTIKDTYTNLHPEGSFHEAVDVAPAVVAESVIGEGGVSDVVRSLFAEILGSEVDDSSDFMDLGGDSLSAINLIARLEDVGLDVTLEDFLASPSVAGVVDLIAQRGGHVKSSLSQVDPLRGLKTGMDRRVSDAENLGDATYKEVKFSLFFFSDDSAELTEDQYGLVLEGARWADENGLWAVWTPERHFHRFGGLYPNPAVLSAALAVATRSVQLRAGSIIAPLHSPLRLAEDWAVVDNLSKGRVGVSFASGFHARDFTQSPESYADRRHLMYETLDAVRGLWRGDRVDFIDGEGNPFSAELYPRPLQPNLPTWITASESASTFEAAGACGANVLTGLLGLTLDELSQRIAVYKEARRRQGLDPEAGEISLMLHTFVVEESEVNDLESIVRDPFCRYLASHVELIRNQAAKLSLDFDRLGQADEAALVEFAFRRYYERASLIGAPEKCAEFVRKLARLGVTEIACLLDFGLERRTILEHLPNLLRVQAVLRAMTSSN